MKDGVDRLEGIGESKSEGMGAGLCDDVIGTKILFRELLRRTSGVEMFGFDEYLIANFEIWCQRSVFVGRDLVSFLGIRDHRLELLVKLIKVHYKVAGVGGDKVSFRVDREVWVVALIGEEW